MRFTNFFVKNFKGIKSLNLTLNKSTKVYTFVGLNESGKTSILEAIDAFYSTVKLEDRHSLIPKSEKLNFNGTIEISASLEFDAKDKPDIEKYLKEKDFAGVRIGDSVTVERKYEFKDSNPTKQTNLWTIDISVRKKGGKWAQLFRTNKDLWHEVIKLVERDYFPDIIYYPNFLFDFPSKIYLEPGQVDSVEFDKYFNVIQDILYSIDPKLNVNDHILSRLKTPNPSNVEALDATLSRMSTKVSQVVFKAWEKLFRSGIKEIVIRSGSEVTTSGTPAYFLQFRLKEGSDHFFIAERSLGFKWFFSFLLFTEFRKNRATDKGELLFLLDEPASNLHSTAQRNLLSTFEELITKSYLIYTTHSHHLINPDWLNGIFIVKNKALDYQDELNFNSSQTDIEVCPYRQFAAKYPSQREYFQPILETLDHQPGLLERVPSIVITEGKFDYFVLKYLNKVHFDGKYDIALYPGGGADADVSIIRLYLAWERKFLILRDSDPAGIKAIKAYVSLFGPEVVHKAYSYADISAELDGLSIEGLFADEDKLAICKSLDVDCESYDKSKFNYAIQVLLSERRHIELLPLTVKRFESVFEFLIGKLAP